MPEKIAPFRADHVGSLLRPRELLRAREQHQKGELSAAALREIEDRYQMFKLMSHFEVLE